LIAEVPKLLLATTNPGKIREYRSLLGDLGYEIVTLSEEEKNKATTESGNSYEQNAQLKAATLSLIHISEPTRPY